MPDPDKNSAARDEEDKLTYHVPDQPPAPGSVTVNRDGTFVYTPALDADDSSTSPPG